MQESNRITLLGVIMVNFKTNSKAILKSELVRKIYIYSKYSITFPVKYCFKESKMDEKNIQICSSQHNEPMQQKKGDKHFL